MSIIVQKFGGTSVADVEKIINITDKIIKELNNNHQIVVVISAMAGVTNQLISYCKTISPMIEQSDLQIADFIISNGENISTGLTALALQQKGFKAIALQGWQVPINTNTAASKALINSIDAQRIHHYLNAGYTPIISGFQGVDQDGHITTLGRGGSDITATAIAAALQANSCDIYTDVSGVYSCDPRILPQAHKITALDYDSMLEFSYCGAKVLHPRSVEIAKEFNLTLKVISSFDEIQGTQILKGNNMELSKIIGIAQNKNLLQVNLISQDLTSILHIFAKADLTIHSSFINDSKITLITALDELIKLEKTLRTIQDQNIISSYTLKSDISMINLIGHRLLNEPALMIKIMDIISTTPIISMQTQHNKISIICDDSLCPELTKNLHINLLD